MKYKIVVSDGVDLEAFKANLKANRGTCICSINYENEEMKCMCKEFKDMTEEQVCHCGIFKKQNI